MRNSLYSLLCLLFISLIFSGCRDDVELFLSETVDTGDQITGTDYMGFYQLNEGNMGSNKSTLDYFDFDTGRYKRNIYAEVNPNVPKELGDVGNDIAIYGRRLYAVINTSNKVEVMDARTAQRIGQIEIPNCRFIKFHKQYAYVTSYAGPVTIDPNYKQLGYVAKVDTATLKQVDRCLVGFQPDELDIVDGKIYVANSGGYMGAGETSGYERTVSVIDLATFTEDKRIDVAYNLERLKADRRGNLWVSSRGDYYTLPSRLFFIDKEKQIVTDTIPKAASNYWLDDDLLYVYGSEFSYLTYQWTMSYYVVDTRTRKIVREQIITDGTDKKIEKPYGIMVHPDTKDIYITDAGDYVSPGLLYCFTNDGKKKWAVRTGDIPGHFALRPIYPEEQKEFILSALKSITSLDKFTNGVELLSLKHFESYATTVFALPDNVLGDVTFLKSKKETSRESFSEEEIKRHIVVGAYTIDKLKSSKVLTTVEGEKLFVKVENGTVFINDVALTDTTPIEARRNLIYVLDEMIPNNGL